MSDVAHLMEPSRQIMWDMGKHGFLDAATVLMAASLAVGFAVRIGAWRRGNKGAPARNQRARLVAALRAIVTNKGMIRGRLYLAMHRCIFYGLVLLSAGSIAVALEMHFGLKLLRGAAYLGSSLILDLAGAAVLAGTGLAAWKRYVVRPDRQENRAGDAILLAMLAATVSSAFLLKGQRLAATSDPWAAWSPIGNAVAWLLGKIIAPENATGFYATLWYVHAVLAFTLMALIPWTKLLHIVAVPLNLYLSDPWAERASLAEVPAGFPNVTGTVADFSRKQLVEADACVACGRCKKLCSIYQGGIPAAPATVMKSLKSLVHRGSFNSPLVGSVIDEAALWSCSACRSCEDRCPMSGSHATRIVDIRRGCTEIKRVPEAVSARFEENEKTLAVSKKRKLDPLATSDVYIWPGCREGKAGQAATLGILKGLLKRAGLTVTVLEPPACCGGPVRRLGNESLFLRDAAANIDYLQIIEGKTIITHCPHCFNTLKNEYPQFGGNFRVMHHSQYLAGLLARGRPNTGGNRSLKFVFHDPCFLGRYNAEFSAPRKLIGSVKELTLLEMKHSRMKSLCCGSGGGTVPEAVALKNGRALVRQAVKAGAAAIVTCCPYCNENLAAAALEEFPGKPPQILDVIEIFDSGGVHETFDD